MKAIDESKERLLLISPWIRAGVVDDALVSRFRGAAQRGVQVMIGHGIGEDRKGNRSPKTVDRDLRAKGKLERLAEEFDNFRLREFGDTHAKCSSAIRGSWSSHPSIGSHSRATHR